MTTNGQRLKRQGNYTPERIKAIEKEVAARYARNESARSLAKEYGISKMGVRGCVERNGGQWRDRQAAGVLCQTVSSELRPEEAADTRPVAQQVAEKKRIRLQQGLVLRQGFPLKMRQRKQAQECRKP